MSNLDEQKKEQQHSESAKEKSLHYLSDAERREWSGLSEWRDPLDKPKPKSAENDGKFALASLLCGIAAMLTLCSGFANAIFGAAAIICGILAKKKQRKSAETLANIGIILGIIGIGVAIVLLIISQLTKMEPPTGIMPDVPV